MGAARQAVSRLLHLAPNLRMPHFPNGSGAGLQVIGARCCRMGGSGATVGTRCAGSVLRHIRCFSCGGLPFLSHRRRNRPRHRGLSGRTGHADRIVAGRSSAAGISGREGFGGAQGAATGISRPHGRVAIQNRLNRQNVCFWIDLCIINDHNVPDGIAVHGSCPQGGADSGNTIIRVPMRVRVARPRTTYP